MIKHKEIRIVEEDLVVGDEPTVAEIKFGHGYDNFQISTDRIILESW